MIILDYGSILAHRWEWPKVLRTDAMGIESLCARYPRYKPFWAQNGHGSQTSRDSREETSRKRRSDAVHWCKFLLMPSTCFIGPCQPTVFFFSAHTFHVSSGPFCKSVWMCMVCMCELQLDKLNMDVYMYRVIHIYKHLQWSSKELHSSSSENKTQMVVLNITTCTNIATFSIERLSFHVLGNPK